MAHGLHRRSETSSTKPNNDFRPSKKYTVIVRYSLSLRLSLFFKTTKSVHNVHDRADDTLKDGFYHAQSCAMETITEINR